MPSVWDNFTPRFFSVEAFADYAPRQIATSHWKGDRIVLHNTGEPTLKERPNGLSATHIHNLISYYRDQQKWHAGPHLFVDQLGIWVFSPLTQPGVHSPSWNDISYGIEQVGNFDTEPYLSGAGNAVRANAVAALAILCHGAKIDTSQIFLHRMDPKTTHKDCPGKNCADQYETIKANAHAYILDELVPEKS